MNIFYNKCTQTKFHCALSKIAKQKLKRQQQSRITHISDEKKNIRKIAFSKYVNGSGVLALVLFFEFTENCAHNLNGNSWCSITVCTRLLLFTLFRVTRCHFSTTKIKKKKQKLYSLRFLRKKYLIEAQKKRY